MSLPPETDASQGPRAQPQSLSDLFFSFSWMALQGFGGVLAVAQRVLVEQKRWYTRDEFVEDWAVAQILPGPNVINLAIMIGDRYFGLPGAMAALAGMLAAPLVVVLVVAALFAGVAEVPAAQGALRGMGAVAAGLITATGLKLAAALRTNVMGLVVSWGFAAAAFIAVALLRVPLAWALLGLGSLSCLWAFRQLGRVRNPGAAT
ncbi:MAG: chromate transporter [Bdellovibrionales bacterium]|nr:chromate transporter [Ramlibacter sp.]